jgi:thioredoxin reductase
LSLEPPPENLVDMNEYDVAVIGGGAAGLSAALVLTRARRRVAVVDAGAPRNAPALHMHGFIGRDGTPPSDLLDAAREEVRGYGGQILFATATAITRRPDGAGLSVELGSAGSIGARRILVATGLRDEVPDVPGVRERWGRDLLHCPYCHGYEVRDQPLGVLGGTPGAVEHALLLRQWSADVVLFPHTDDPTLEEREQLTARAVGVVDGRVERLVVTDDRLTGVQLASGDVVPRAAVFVRPRMVPQSDLLASLGCTLDKHGWPVTDSTGRTSAPDVWVAGNAGNPRAQVVTAAGEGSTAAIALNADLVADDTRRALHDLRSGLPA